MKLSTKIRFGFLAVIAVLAMHTCVFDRATWYGESWRGRKMANGKPYNPDVLTCASWNYPLGTKLRITHEKRSVTVEVTDRGGRNRWYQFGKTIDLTPVAFAKIAALKTGSIEVQIRRAD
jgi:rare lipoprotein A